jgi:hypothetical protein
MELCGQLHILATLTQAKEHLVTPQTSLTANVDARQEKNLLPLSGIKPLVVPP